MIRNIFLIASITCFSVVCNAQTSYVNNICEVWGSVQGVVFDSFLNKCSANSSSEACEDVLQKLGTEFKMATLTRKSYAEANVQGCKIVLKAIEDGIYFSIEGSASLIKQLKSHLGSYSKSSDCE